ncbi:hypothetical protein QL285_084814 [Trifolium repens]|nr:hypothetical protein QL285_084814 [Trifolium repens]
MKNDVSVFINSCAICQQTKHPNHLPYGLLQPLPIPEAVWEDISLDFITGLPSFQNYTTILVVVDRFSKAAHFGKLHTSFTASAVAELFAEIICKLHGMLKSIVFDRDPIFLSHFWQELFRLSGTKLRMSSAYHPQSDGQTEIVNKALQQYLRCFVFDNPTKWGKYLKWAEWHYNSSIHSSTGLTPFQIVYGKPPPTLSQYVLGSSKIEAVETDLMTRDTVMAMLKTKLLKAQTVMKLYADKKRIPHPFKVGDLVFIKLRPYRQSSLGSQYSHKLSKRYYGPFTLLRAIGEVAFEVDLPAASKIHRILHVSQLKPCNDPAAQPLNLPPNAKDNSPVIQPVTALDWRLNSVSNKPEILVQWQGLYPEDTTWEDLAEMKQLYPNIHLEDKVLVQEDGNVMDLEAEEEDHMNSDNEELGPIPLMRAQRNKTRPKWMNNFQIPKKLQ